MRAFPAFLLACSILAIGFPARAAGAGTPPMLPLMQGAKPLATPSGSPLFPRLAGLPMPGWLAAFGSSEMGTAYEGFHQRIALPAGMALALVRTGGLMGAYVVKGDRCIGDLVGEPLLLPAAEDVRNRLGRAGFAVRSRILGTPSGDFAVSAMSYERQRTGYVERYVFTLHDAAPGTPLEAREYLSEAGYFPVTLREPMDQLAREIETDLVTSFRANVSGIATPP